MEKNDYIQIDFELNEIEDLIKNYYKSTPIKSCEVHIEAKNIKDKLKEIDLFHHDKFFYNLLFKTRITGKIKDEDGHYNQYNEELNEEGTKELVKAALAPKYNVSDLKIGYSFYEDTYKGGIGVQVTHMVGNIDKKVLTKKLK